MEFELTDLIIKITIFIFGCLCGYLVTYAKKKGENRALLEDIAKLTDEKQKVIHTYESKLQEQQKIHTLDIEKRKYRYEEKSKQFSNFFSLLDEFNNKSNVLFQEDIQPIMTKFFTDYLSQEAQGNKVESSKIISEFMSEIQKMITKLDSEHLRIKTETNTIRLIASEKMVEILNELELAFKDSYDTSVALMKSLGKPENFQNISFINTLQTKVIEKGSIVQEKRNELMNQMKIELDQI